MIVAYHFPHNDGIEYGILDKPYQDTGLTLVDLYEVDGQIRTFEHRYEAEDWLNAEFDAMNRANDGGIPTVSDVGTQEHFSYEQEED